MNKYTLIDNRIIDDYELSDTAFRILSFILSKPEGYIINNAEICKKYKYNRSKISLAFNELTQHGYIERIKRSDGHFKIILKDLKKETKMIKKGIDILDLSVLEELDENIKELFIEYIEFRNKKRITTNQFIFDALFKRFNELGGNYEIIETALVNNWKNFYSVDNLRKGKTVLKETRFI